MQFGIYASTVERRHFERQGVFRSVDAEVSPRAGGLAKGTGIIKTGKTDRPWHRHGTQAQAADGRRWYAWQATRFGSS